MRRTLSIAIVLVLAFGMSGITPEPAQAYIPPGGELCSSPYGQVTCTQHIHWACTSCMLYNWSFRFPTVWSKKGTKIVHCSCDDGFEQEEWYNAPCGQCDPGSIP